MKDFAKKYIDWYQGLDKVVKILLCILWDVPANLYRLAKSAQKRQRGGHRACNRPYDLRRLGVVSHRHRIPRAQRQDLLD